MDTVSSSRILHFLDFLYFLMLECFVEEITMLPFRTFPTTLMLDILHEGTRCHQHEKSEQHRTWIFILEPSTRGAHVKFV
jgi:hypothetical protein